MKYYGRAEETGRKIVEAFRAGNLPAALAQVFIHHAGDGVPCHAWSWSNQLLVALSGSADARGYRQWQAADRHVKSGAHAIHILIPLVAKKEKEDAAGQKTEDTFLYGFKSAPVFRYEDTEGAELPGNAAAAQFISALPLVEVARSWGLTVQVYNGAQSDCAGYYLHGQAIALGVENLSTWAHELVHAADDRLGELRASDKLHREAVAELGGATLLKMIGEDTAADLGGAWDYINHYAQANGKDTISICVSVLNRVARAVALIMETSAQTVAA